jgi:hypothetical protein
VPENDTKDRACKISSLHAPRYDLLNGLRMGREARGLEMCAQNCTGIFPAVSEGASNC